MFPSYPIFRFLKKEDQPVFDLAFKENPPQISEFTFTNLYAWREAYKFKVSLLEDFIIISLEQGGKTKFLNPIGRGNPGKAIEAILKEVNAELVRIPEKTKVLFEKNPRFNLLPDRDNADYLYKTCELIALKGTKYDAKRNFIKRFKANYQYEYLRISADNIQECLDFEEVWCSKKGCDSIKSLHEERSAFKEMLLNFSDFRLKGGAIKLEDRLVAVALAELLNPDTMVMHILKASPDINGLYQTILNEFLIREASAYEYLNLEQDLGVSGLRKAKLSYQPCKLVMKYILKFK